MKKVEEIWRPVVEYEGLYEVSNLGRVRGIPRGGCDGRVLKQGLNDKGYYCVNLSKHCVIKRCRVHRLVAMAFIPNPNNYPSINHKDENPHNNHVDNLEWCTQKYNMNYGTARERAALKNGKKIAQYTIEGVLVATYNSSYEAMRKTGIIASHIRECCKGGCYVKRKCGRRWKNIKTAGGYVWREINKS